VPLRFFKARIQHLSSSLPDVGGPEANIEQLSYQVPNSYPNPDPNSYNVSTTYIFLAIYQS
jgi:hypothetical protein